MSFDTMTWNIHGTWFAAIVRRMNEERFKLTVDFVIMYSLRRSRTFTFSNGKVGLPRRLVMYRFQPSYK